MAAPMDATSGETAEKDEILTEKKAAKGVLNLFWKLAEGNDQTRETAVIGIVAQLAEKRAKLGEDESNSELEYCLERLVRGLQSSRNAARLGYYVALVEILRKFTDVKPSQMTGLIANHLLTNPPGKQEINPLIAMTLTYGALIRSGRILEDPHSLKHVCKELLKLHSTKDFLQELCATFLVEIFEKVETSLFSKYAWPVLQPNFTAGWSTCTPDSLWMMLVLSEKQEKAADEKFLSKHWQGKRLLTTKNFPRIAEICLSSSKSHPHVHPVCSYVLDLLNDNERFSEFWKLLVEGAMAKQHKEKQYLVFELLKESLDRRLTTANRVSQLLLPDILRTFVTNLAHPVMLLHGAATQMANAMMKTVAEAKDGEIQFEIMKCLLTHPGMVMFDQVTRTTMVAGIIPHLKPEATSRLSLLLRLIFNGSPSGKESEAKSGEKPVESEVHRAAALRMLTTLPGQNESRKDLLQYFALHAFFNQLSRSDDIPQCSNRPAAVSQSLHDASRECFDKLLSVSPKRMSASHGSTVLQHHCNVLSEVLHFVSLLLLNPEVASPCAPLSDEVHQAFLQILKKAKAAEKQANDEGQASTARAFLMLFLNLGLQLFVDSKHTLSILPDLYVCYDKAFNRKAKCNSKKDDGEPQWIEVVVDLLLSLLSKNSQALRVVVNNVFLLLLPHFTTTALRQVLDVIDPSRDDDESVMENESAGGDSAGSGSSSSSESEDNVDGDELSESTLALKRSVKAALGDAAEDSDDEGEEETYLDDAAMEQVDESLAQAFRSMRKKKSGLSSEDEALLHFRNRCLEVLGLIVPSRPSTPFILPALFTVLSALDFGQREKHQESLASSATTCLRRLFAIKKFQYEDSSDDQLDFKDILRQLVNRFQTVSDHRWFVLISDACTFVFRCALYCDAKEERRNSYVAGCISVYKDSLREHIMKTDCHIPGQLFSPLIITYSVHGWELADVLLECAFGDGIRLFRRTRAVCMMVTLTSHHRQVQRLVSQECWTTFSQTCIGEIPNLLDKMMSGELKQNFISKMLQLAYNIVYIDQETVKEISKYEVLLSTFGQLVEKGVGKESKSYINRIMGLLNKSSDSGKKRSGSAPGKKSKKVKAA